MGGLGGLSWWADRGWTVEARGAVYDRGDLPNPAKDGYLIRDVAFGVTSRIGWRLGGGVAPAWDPVTNRFDPESFERLALPPDDQGRLAAQVMLEGGFATQSLANPARPIEAMQDPAGFVDLQGRLRVGALRLYATARARTLSMVQFDAPGLPPFVASSTNGTATPELSAIIGAEARVAVGIVPGLILRVQQPAAVMMDIAALGIGASSRRIVMVRHPNELALVPAGSPVSPKMSATASVRLEPVSDVSIIGGLDVGYDPLGGVSWNANPNIDVAFSPVFALSGSALVQVRFQ